MSKLMPYKNDIIKLYNGGFSTTQIGDMYKASNSAVYSLLRKYKVKTRSIRDGNRLRYLNNSLVSDKLLCMIDGWLLGDGSMNCRGTGQSSFEHASKHKEYSLFVKDQFESEGIRCNFGKCFSKKSSTYYYRISTQRTQQFENIYKKWYVDRKKIVPKDLVLCKETIKNWIMDDGSVDKRDGILSFHTNAFSSKECWFLCDRLKEIVYNAKLNVILCKKKYPRINMCRKDTYVLFDMIGDCDVNCFRYKWERRKRLCLD